MGHQSAGIGHSIGHSIRKRIAGWLRADAGPMTVLAAPAMAAPYGPQATTPAEVAVAGALDAIAAPTTGAHATMLDAIDNLPDAASQADALGQLSVRNYRLLPHLAIQSMDASDREVRRYLAQRRNAMLDGDAPGGGNEITFMLSGGLRQGKYEARPDRPRANSDSRSIRAGIDISPVEGLVLGATLGVEGTDANLDRTQRPRITQTDLYVGPYASYTNGTFYVDATAGYDRTWYKLRRQVLWQGFSDQLTTDADGDNAAATLEAGGILQSGNFRAEPFAGLHYRYADVSSFVEQGGSAALAVAKYKAESVRSSLGLRTSVILHSGDWSIRPDLELQWQRELNSSPDSRIEAIFLTGETPVFTLGSSRYYTDRDAGIVGAGISMARGERTAIKASYTGEFAADHRIHAFALTGSLRF